MNNLTIADRQAMIDKANRLNAVQAVGLVPANYTKVELKVLEELLVQVNSAARFCRIDHAAYLNSIIERECKVAGMGQWERDQRVYLSYCRLAERYGIKPETLKSEVSTMKQWPYHERVEGLTVGHYRVIPAQLPRNIAIEILVDAAEGQRPVAWVQSACYEHIDMAHIEQAEKEQQPVATTNSYGTGGWITAQQWVDRHEIERMYMDGPTACVFHSSSGILRIESESPITFTTKEINQP